MSGIHIGKRRRTDSTHRNKNTLRAETQDTQKRSAAREKGRGRETTLPVIRSSRHRILRWKPFFHPPQQQVETGRTGGRGDRYISPPPTGEETGRIGGLGGRYSIPPPVAQEVTGRAGGCEGQGLLLGALPVTPGPEFE